MGGWLVLIAVFCLFQAFVRRKERKKTAFNWKEAAFNWKEAAECEREQDVLRQERLAMLPTRQERIQSCYQSLEQIQGEWAAWQKSLQEVEPEKSAEEPVAVFYTHDLMDRAIVVWDGKQYVICFEKLSLASENALARIYTPCMPCGSWYRSYPSRFFDTQEEAERIAQKAMQWLN